MNDVNRNIASLENGQAFLDALSVAPLPNEQVESADDGQSQASQIVAFIEAERNSFTTKTRTCTPVTR